MARGASSAAPRAMGPGPIGSTSSGRDPWGPDSPDRDASSPDGPGAERGSGLDGCEGSGPDRCEESDPDRCERSRPESMRPKSSRPDSSDPESSRPDSSDPESSGPESADPARPVLAGRLTSMVLIRAALPPAAAPARLARPMGTTPRRPETARLRSWRRTAQSYPQTALSERVVSTNAVFDKSGIHKCGIQGSVGRALSSAPGRRARIAGS
jgi:hypothetical protein